VVSLLEHAGGSSGDVFGTGDILPILLEAMIGKKGSRGRGYEGSSGMLKNFKELKVWQKACSLCLDIYRFSREFHKEEKFGLTSQVRTAAEYIPLPVNPLVYLHQVSAVSFLTVGLSRTVFV
jgi:hypothetical protein